MGIAIDNCSKLYLDEKSEVIREFENSYDLDFPIEQQSSYSTGLFSDLVREIAYCREHNRPAKQKIKNLKLYRDYDLLLK